MKLTYHQAKKIQRLNILIGRLKVAGVIIFILSLIMMLL